MAEGLQNCLFSAISQVTLSSQSIFHDESALGWRDFWLGSPARCWHCREARMDQKVARREAAKEREASPEITKLPGGGDVMGGDDSLAAAKAR